MSKHPPEKIYAITRYFLPDMDEDTRRQADSLLKQAEAGQDTSLDLLDLLTREESLRLRVRSLLKSSEWDRLLGGPSNLPGMPGTTPGKEYVCPVIYGHYRFNIAEEGEKPPRCPEHDVELVPKE